MRHLQDSAYDAMYASIPEDTTPIDRLTEDEASELRAEFIPGDIEISECAGCGIAVTIDSYINRCVSGLEWYCDNGCHTDHVIHCNDCWEY